MPYMVFRMIAANELSMKRERTTARCAARVTYNSMNSRSRSGSALRRRRKRRASWSRMG